MPLSDKQQLQLLSEENEQLREAVGELTLLNELAASTAGMQELDEILQHIISSSMRAIGAEQGVITLVDSEKGDELRTLVRSNLVSGTDQAFRPNDHVLGWMQLHKKPIVINDVGNDDRFPFAKWDENIRSILSVPLVNRSNMIGILTLYNNVDPDGFKDTAQRLLTIIAAQSAEIISGARLRDERAHVIRLFGQHTSPAIVEQLVRAGPETEGVRKKVCVMFLDVRGFTTFSERRMPEEVVAYLNQLFEISIEIVNDNGGNVHQLLGDGFMAIFGAPISHGNDSHNAVTAAMTIIENVRRECATGNLSPTNIGIGLHTGEVVAGSVGSTIHKEYKVTGDVVNLAARIESMNKTYDSHLLISAAVLEDLPPETWTTEEIGSVQVRGRSNSVKLYRLA
ncbi:MAG: GAF domain-containing protein [Bacteroidetes bacterium]|nr:MAG: GAF domain-containing protein [Bacteroidota bacterium]